LQSRADFSNYLDGQKEFGIICVTQEFLNAPIAEITLADLRDHVSVEKISHAVTLPQVEKIVVVEVRHLCKDFLQRTLHRLTKQGFPQDIAVLSLRTAAVSHRAALEGFDQLLVQFTNEKLRHGFLRYASNDSVFINMLSSNASGTVKPHGYAKCGAVEQFFFIRNCP
jgi:hypothetical protein